MCIYGHDLVHDVETVSGFIQANMSKIQGFFKDLSSLSYSFQGLKVNEKYWSKCSNSISEILDWDNGDIRTGKLV